MDAFTISANENFLATNALCIEWKQFVTYSLSVSLRAGRARHWMLRLELVLSMLPLRIIFERSLM